MQEELSAIPERPGVYIFKDADNKVLYVGKAKELKSRIRSYFQRSSALDARKSAMMREVRDFEYTVTGNELEAFVLEANLIKQYRPHYNILLRDDKSYPYLKLTVKEYWPRLEVVRRIQKDGAKYFGPYVPSGAMWEILSFIRNNFHIRTCRYSLEKRVRPCIQHQIKRCIAPCAGNIAHKEYIRMINEVKLLLEGKNKGLLASLEKRMKGLSEEMRYEEASLLRDRIKAIKKISESQKAVAPGLGDIDVIGIFRKEKVVAFKMLFVRNGFMIGSRHFFVKDMSGETSAYMMKNLIGQFYTREIIPPSELICSSMPEDSGILSSWLSDKKGSPVRISVPKKGIKRRLVGMAEENAMLLSESGKDLYNDRRLHDIAAFLDLKKVPEDVGAFDISNISGKESVGAFVYWADGNFQKGRYRHTKMDAVKGPDDYSMMKEMIRRTLKKSEGGNQNSEEIKFPKAPDLLIIDGGRGHLEAARQALKELGVVTEVIGIAKDPDRVFLKDGAGPVALDDGNASSLLLKRMRDEAHRFAISYHKKLRAKKVFESPLEKISGVGKKRRFELLRHFGSIEAIRNAPAEEIAGLKGLNRKIAGRILESLATERKV